MPSEGHFGIRYDMDFPPRSNPPTHPPFLSLPPLHTPPPASPTLIFSRFFPVYCDSSFVSRLCFHTVELVFYLWQYLTQRQPVS